MMLFSFRHLSRRRVVRSFASVALAASPLLLSMSPARAQQKAAKPVARAPFKVTSDTGVRGLPVASANINFLETAEKERRNPPARRAKVPEQDPDADNDLPAPTDAERNEVQAQWKQSLATAQGGAFPSVMAASANPLSGVQFNVAPAPPGGVLANVAPPPVGSFSGLRDDGTSIPPDAHGAVGPNHVMTTLNSQVRIQTRTGGVLSTVSLNGFWGAVGPVETYDPKIIFDALANRWVFVSCTHKRSAQSAILIGASKTSDPTGAWSLFKIDADAANTRWADFPSLGFNKKWIALQLNMFPVAGGTSISRIWAFDKARLYAASGATAAHTVFTSDQIGFTQVPALTYDATQETLYLVNNWNGNGNGKGHVRLHTLTGTASAPVFTTGAFVTTDTPWGSGTGIGDFAPQFGSAAKINNNDSRIQNAVYRNGSLWFTQNNFLPALAPTRTSVQWWQVNPQTAAVQQIGRVDDATNVNFYAFPSLAVNQANDVLVGYSRFSPTTYASAGYSFRRSTDPLSALQAPFIYKAGEAPYFRTLGGTENRWGDYSATVVDPVNDTDFWTVQEYAVSPGNTWGTWWAKVPATLPTAYNAADLSTGGDGKTRLLWARGNGAFALWRLNAAGALENGGGGAFAAPGGGYTVRRDAIAVTGGDNKARVLLTKDDNSSVALWRLNAANTAAEAGWTYGPFTGWAVQDLAVTSDNKTYLLWSNAGSGETTVWRIGANGVTEDQATFAPVPGYAAHAIGVGADNRPVLLWAGASKAQIWNLSPTGFPGKISGFAFNGSTGWSVTDLAVGPDNKARVLWTKGDGSAALWRMNVGGSVIEKGAAYSAAPSWMAKHITVGGDGVTRLQWNNVNRQMSLWRLDDGLTLLGGTAFGPL